MSAPKAQPMGSSGQVPAPSPGDTVPPSGGHDYPLTFSVDYPDRSLNRLTTAFRIFTAIPIAILAATLGGGGFGASVGGAGARYAGGGIAILVIPVALMLLFRRKYIVLFFLTISALFAAIFAWFAILFTGRYPRSLFDLIEGVIRWHNRVAAHAFLPITDRYPPFSVQA